METRLELHEKLCDILGSRNVYFQPPESIKMKYPAIVYKRDNIRNYKANNGVYRQKTVYQVTVIDKDPDSEVVYKLSVMPYCQFNRHYTADNLNHDIFQIYY